MCCRPEMPEWLQLKLKIIIKNKNFPTTSKLGLHVAQMYTKQRLTAVYVYNTGQDTEQNK